MSSSITTEVSKGKDRPALPRVRGLSATAAVGEPSTDRNAGGLFAAGNKAATERSVKQLLKRQLGREATDAIVQELYRETRIQFLAELARMPNRSPAVQRDLAARARWSALSARYATMAAEVGLGSDLGMKYVDLAMRLDQRAERLGVTALAISERLAKVTPKATDPYKALDAAFGTPALPSAKRPAPPPVDSSSATDDPSRGQPEPGGDQ